MSAKPKAIDGTYTQSNRVKLVKGGAEYFDLLKLLIDKAKHTIHLQVYIFKDDTTGLKIAEALIAASKRGVKVYFIVDGYATERLPAHFLKQLKSSGVHFRRFEPLLKSRYFYFGRRLHHKVFVADASYALVTGVNITDRYNDMPGAEAWKDMALYVEGETAVTLDRRCCDIWNKTYGLAAKVKPLLNSLPFEPITDAYGPCDVRVRVNDRVKGKKQVWNSYWEMFTQSSENIIIMCSYFLPGRAYRKQMVKAVQRGVRLTVILAGRSDVPLAKYAERYLYKWMLDNNMEIYEYQPNILHAKVAVRDGEWMTIGSYNVNNISALASVELNLDVQNKKFVHSVEKELRGTILNDCVPVTRDNYIVRTHFLKRFAQRVAYETVKLMLFLVTFYYKRER